jgi:hypothetical protein
VKYYFLNGLRFNLWMFWCNYCLDY